MRKQLHTAARATAEPREALASIVARLREAGRDIPPGGLHFEILDAYDSPSGVPCVNVAEGIDCPPVTVLRSLAPAAVKLLQTIGVEVPDGFDPLLRLVEFSISTPGVSHSATLRVAPAFDPDGGTAHPLRSVGARDRNQLQIVADALERAATAKPDADPTSYVSATTLYRERFDTYKQLRAFLKKNPDVRSRKPSAQRLEIHAGDWHRYWMEHDRRQSEALDDEALQEQLADIEARRAEESRRKATR